MLALRRGRCLLDVLLGFLADEFADGIPGPSAHVSVSGMRPFGLVVDEPGVEVGL